MNDKFIASVKRRFKILKKDNPYFIREELVENVLSLNASKEFEDVTDYHIGFFSLFQENKKLDKILEKQQELLSNPAQYRQDISYGIGIMIRELRLPEENESKWQLLYETTVFPEEQSGPIMHLYFDGWELINCKIYYWDEVSFNDISGVEELVAAKKKISAYGFQLNDNLGDEATLMIKKMLDERFGDDDNNIQDHQWNFGKLTDNTENSSTGYRSENHFEFEKLIDLNTPFFKLEHGILYDCKVEYKNEIEDISIIPLAFENGKNVQFVMNDARRLFKENPHYVREIINMDFNYISNDGIKADYPFDYDALTIACATQDDGTLIDYGGSIFFDFRRSNEV